MKKKNYILCSLLLIAMIFTSCSSSEGNDEVANNSDTVSGLEPIKVVVFDASDSDFVDYDIHIKNTTDAPINTVTINVSLLDENNNIVDGTYPQTPYRILPGQTAAIDGISKLGEASFICLDSYTYYDAEGNYVEGDFDSDLQTVDISTSGTIVFNEDTPFDGSEIEDDISVSNKENDDLEVVALEYTGIDSAEYKNFEVTLKNNTDKTVKTITANIIMLDENGNIISATYPQEPNKVKSGQSITIEALTNKDGVAYFTIDGYSYYEGENYVDKFLNTIPKAVAIK